MIRFAFACTLAVTLFAAGQTEAQTLNDLAQWNMQQDAQFFQWAEQGSWEVARQLPDNVSSSEIIGAMQPYTVDNTWGSYNDGWWHNQQVQSDAMNDWSHMMRGEALYSDGYGNSYYLPYEHDTYHYDNGGYINGGESYYDYNNELYLDSGYGGYSDYGYSDYGYSDYGYSDYGY